MNYNQQQKSLKEIIPELNDNKRYHLKYYRKEIYQMIPRHLRAPVENKKEYSQETIIGKKVSASLLQPKKGSKNMENYFKENVTSPKKRTLSRPI